MNSTSSFARVRGYLPRFDGGLWVVYSTGFLSALLWPCMVVVLGMIVQLLVTAGNIQQGTGLGLLIKRYPGLENRELCLFVLLGVGLALGSAECLVLYFLDRSVKRAAQRATTRLRGELRRQAYHLAGSELFGQKETSLVELFTNRMEIVRQGLAAWWSTVPRELVRLAMLVALALMLNVWLTLAAMILACLIWQMLVWMHGSWKHRQALLDDRAALQRSMLVESLRQVRLVRGYMLDD